MNIDKIMNLMESFLESHDWTLLHLRAETSNGHQRELAISNPQTMPAGQSIKETFTEKVLRLHHADTLSPEDTQWWKNLQQRLAVDGTRPQILFEDSDEVVLQKLEEGGIIN